MSKLLVNYHVFTALRMLAVEDYEAGRLSASRLADLLEVKPKNLLQAAMIVRCTQEVLNLNQEEREQKCW